MEAIFDTIKWIESAIPWTMVHPLSKDEQWNNINIEIIQISYDQSIISYEMLLNIFFTNHDPTTLDRQWKHVGKDVGSWVFTHDGNQKDMIKAMIESLHQNEVFDTLITTQTAPATEFTIADPEHHKYYQRNPQAADCVNIISPKMDRLRKLRECYLKD